MSDQQGSAHLRLAVVGVVVLSLFAALLSRAVYLQVMDSSAFQVQARNNRVRLVYEPAPRGRILDRQDNVMVDNRVANVITLSRDSAVKNPQVIDRLAALLHVEDKKIKARATDVRFSPYTPIPIIDEASEEAIIYVREHQEDFPGVEAARVAERAYPHATLAAHLVGYVGKANQQELDARRGGNYQPGDEIGKSGVELAFEPWLRGTPGETRLEVDSGDRIVRTLFHRDPVPGHDIRLTIDLAVQTATESALQRALNAAHGTYDRNTRKSFVAPAGSAVVMDPRDGSIRAIASYPTFDPSSFVGGISTEQFKALSAPDAHAPLNDRAIGGEYAPGSTFKLATAIAALDTHLLDPKTTVNDTGKFLLKNCLGDRCVFRNAGDEAHGLVNITRAITVSSDVFFYGLGAQFWNNRSTYGDAIQKEARALGLGSKTGIGLLGEHAGRVPDPASRLAAHNANPKAFPNGGWRTGDNINLSIGQGEVIVTPLQLAQAYATFSKGGVRFVPRVASEVLELSASGPRVAASFAPKPLETLGLRADVVEPIAAGLRGVVSDPKGTAVNAFAGFPLSQYPIAGKTGTAQVRGKQDTALFAAYAPANDPQWAVAVILEESGFGGSVAAPVARRIFDAAFGLNGDNGADVVASGVN